MKKLRYISAKLVLLVKFTSVCGKVFLIFSPAIKKKSKISPAKLCPQKIAGDKIFLEFEGKLCKHFTDEKCPSQNKIDSSL